MEKKFTDIKNKFIVDQAQYPEEKLSRLMEIMLKYLRVSKEGQVVIIKNVSTRKILPLILSARFIANKVDKEIKELITKDELLAYSLLQKEVFRSRFSELSKEGFAESSDKGVKSRNILLVERFLEKLDEKV